MSDIIPVGSSIVIRVPLWNGISFLAGQTAYVAVERISDGYYWNGTAFQSGYTTQSMTELTGNAHKAGVYQYTFYPPVGDGESVYDWSCIVTVGSQTIPTRGRIYTFFAGV